ncbi:collagen-like repeat preface domain-containing protein, partial [Bacillus sp. 166amftsu]|uniref:collagen-like repeat preface domain-containing protein n=1 Tax=Bacillus sp. 166amftsu TaxID=1761753 RepID=UPI00089B8D34
MSYFNENPKKVSKPYFPTQPRRTPAVHYTPIPELYMKLFSDTLNGLTDIIPTVFSNPTPSNITELMNLLEIINGFLKRLNLSLAQRETGIAIVENLITILDNQPFVANATYIELQNLLNFLLYITKLFRVNRLALKGLLGRIEELQITLLQIASIRMTGPQGEQGPQGEKGYHGEQGPQGEQGY